MRDTKRWMFEVMERCQRNGSRLNSSMARRHLLEGFQRRVGLIARSRDVFNDLADPARHKPLNPSETTDLNLHLNSFYLHIRGGLDNLAWVLHYEHKLVGAGTEDDVATQRAVGFQNPNFVKALELKFDALARLVRGMAGWLADLKALRDPVAHRIPLFASPGVITEGSEHHARMTQLEAEMFKAVERGDMNSALALMVDSMGVGEYVPLFVVSVTGGTSPRDLHEQTSADEDAFAAIGDEALRAVFP